MSNLDIERMLQDLSPDAPCGPDLEYDPEFGEMERLARGKPEQQIGETVIAAEPPDWRAVKEKSLELFRRTKDLRVAVRLARALTHTEGFPGLTGALTLIAGLLRQQWDTVHPGLDPDDDLDPTMRLNSLAGLGDPEANLRSVRDAWLVQSRTFGRFSLRDCLVAAGHVPPSPDQAAPDPASVDAAFLDCPLEDLQATHAATDGALEQLRAIESVLAERVGAGRVPDLTALVKELKEAGRILADRLSRRGIAAQAPAQDGAPPAAGAGGRPAAAPLAPGEIASREDAIRVLDKVCDYFNRHEPSSPVPLLLQRAKRLVSRSFLDIVRDLLPEGVAQAERISGVDGRP